MTRSLLVIVVLVALVCCVTSCQTTSKVGQKVSIGMTSQQVLSAVGNPLKKSAHKDGSGLVVEEWTYKETTWDDAGWSWDRTMVTSILTFENGKLTAIGQGPEQQKTRRPGDAGVYIDETHHDRP